MQLWQTIHASSLARHSHRVAYAAVVLSGDYEEAGDHGRFHVQAGHVIIHDRFEAHLDRFSKTGALILNLVLPASCAYRPGIATVADPDSIVHAAEKNRDDAAHLLLATATPVKLQPKDWPDELAAAMIERPSLKLWQWAENKKLASWTLSRGFIQVFGVTAEVFRARARARHAWKLIQNTQEPLAKMAAHLGFADQSHMSRSVKQLTGAGPRIWRAAANGFMTERCRTI